MDKFTEQGRDTPVPVGKGSGRAGSARPSANDCSVPTVVSQAVESTMTTGNLNERGQILDLQETGEPMETGIDPTPQISLDQERELLKSPSPGSTGSGDEVSKAADVLDKFTLKKKRLGGAARKRLSRLLKSGVDYETALKTVSEQRVAQQKPERGQQTPSGQVEATKRLRSDDSTPDQRAKKPREGETVKASFRAAVEGVRVGLIHSDYPTTALTNTQMGLLQQAVMQAVEEIPDEGPQVRFLGCTQRPGWLLITCADGTSVSWLESVVTRLQPWDGARLKFVQGQDLPKPHVCVAYIPDDAGKRLTSEVVLNRLRKMNHGLNTREWTVLHRVEAGPGQTWTFSVDEASMDTLKGLEFRPFCGFGQVQFRPKVRGGKDHPTKTVSGAPSRESEQKSPAKRSEPREHRQGMPGKGKSLPNKPLLKKSGTKPPSKEGAGEKSIPGKNAFKKRRTHRPSKKGNTQPHPTPSTSTNPT